MANEGKIALVTGASQGIGKAAAQALLKEGYRVTLVGRRAELLQQAIDEVGAKDRGLAVKCDVGDPVAVKALFAAHEKAFGGRLDVIFNNAGTGAPAIPMEELTYEQWMTVVNANLTGTFLCTQQAVRIMKNQKPMGAASSTTAPSRRMRPAPARSRTPRPSTASPASRRPRRSTAGRSTSPAARSTSATPSRR